MKREQEHLAMFLHKAKDYARANGFKGTFFIEPNLASQQNINTIMMQEP
jgi:xylose isomerase